MIIAECRLVRNSNNSKKGVRELKKRELPNGPLATGYDSPFGCAVGVTSDRKKSVTSITKESSGRLAWRAS